MRARSAFPYTAGLAAAALAAGAVLLARSVARHGLSQLLPAGRRPIELESDIEIAAPVGEVFTLWSVIENFPRFMSHVREVVRVGPRHYQWKVDGPAGLPVEWTAELCAFAPPERIAWRSVRGSAIRTYGGVRFTPLTTGGTHVRVRMRYHPPAGTLGHSFARLLGADPQQELDEDLSRFRSLLETGQAGGVTRRALESSTPSTEQPTDDGRGQLRQPA